MPLARPRHRRFLLHFVSKGYCRQPSFTAEVSALSEPSANHSIFDNNLRNQLIKHGDHVFALNMSRVYMRFVKKCKTEGNVLLTKPEAASYFFLYDRFDQAPSAMTVTSG